MPTPVGHALGGLIVCVLALPRSRGRRVQSVSLSLVGLFVLVACLPDLDFAWGRHNQETHSIGFAILVWLAVACTAAVGTHVLFDWLGSDDSPPLGVMALWPFSSEFYFAKAFVFEAISRRYWLSGFVSHNLLAVAREVAILLPILGVTYYLRSTSQGAKGTKNTKSTKQGF
jgi:membrane-bound metal-dependent hydrolase YbcI (DUF457 family)